MTVLTLTVPTAIAVLLCGVINNHYYSCVTVLTATANYCVVVLAVIVIYCVNLLAAPAIYCVSSSCYLLIGCGGSRR